MSCLRRFVLLFSLLTLSFYLLCVFFIASHTNRARPYWTQKQQQQNSSKIVHNWGKNLLPLRIHSIAAIYFIIFPTVYDLICQINLWIKWYKKGNWTEQGSRRWHNNRTHWICLEFEFSNAAVYNEFESKLKWQQNIAPSNVLVAINVTIFRTYSVIRASICLISKRRSVIYDCN